MKTSRRKFLASISMLAGIRDGVMSVLIGVAAKKTFVYQPAKEKRRTGSWLF